MFLDRECFVSQRIFELQTVCQIFSHFLTFFNWRFFEICVCLSNDSIIGAQSLIAESFPFRLDIAKSHWELYLENMRSYSLQIVVESFQYVGIIFIFDESSCLVSIWIMPSASQKTVSMTLFADRITMVFFSANSRRETKCLDFSVAMDL